MIWIASFVGVVFLAGFSLLLWGMRWGSTSDERALQLPGDDYFDGKRRAKVAMTRAISINAPPERVWPWIAQLGRGAGWYSVDLLDNGGKVSAWHIVSWIPDTQVGDATGIGYLRHVDPGRSLAWWLGETSFLGTTARMVICYHLRAERHRTRVVSRISADATGAFGHIVLILFRAMDSPMACIQLLGLRRRIEYCERPDNCLRDPETGHRDQYQHYEVVYASGDTAGVAGKLSGAQARQSAIQDGVLDNESNVLKSN